MTATQTFAQLAQYDQHAHALEYGHQGYTRAMLRLESTTHQDQPAVNNWLAARLKQDWSKAAVSDWPSVMADQWYGWRAYYAGAYTQAADYFLQAWRSIEADEEDFGFRSDVMLGLGKLYTRTGHWQAARSWLILYLSEARQRVDLYGVTQGYGALGELLLRAGHSQESLACLNTAFHILPSGSGQQSRQLNYLASALIRNHEWLRAETLLKTSIQNSHDMFGRDGASEEATSSIYHALARLQFLELERHGLAARDVLDVWGHCLIEVLKREASDPSEFLAVAQGFLAVGRALRFAALDQLSDAQSQLMSAVKSFGIQYPMERCWAAQLLQRLTIDAPVCCEAVTQLMALNAIQAPQNLGVLDDNWLQPVFSEDNGFAALINANATFATLSAQWRVFFL